METKIFNNWREYVTGKNATEALVFLQMYEKASSPSDDFMQGMFGDGYGRYTFSKALDMDYLRECLTLQDRKQRMLKNKTILDALVKKIENQCPRWEPILTFNRFELTKSIPISEVLAKFPTLPSDHYCSKSDIRGYVRRRALEIAEAKHPLDENVSTPISRAEFEKWEMQMRDQWKAFSEEKNVVTELPKLTPSGISGAFAVDYPNLVDVDSVPFYNASSLDEAVEKAKVKKHLDIWPEKDIRYSNFGLEPRVYTGAFIRMADMFNSILETTRDDEKGRAYLKKNRRGKYEKPKKNVKVSPLLAALTKKVEK